MCSTDTGDALCRLKGVDQGELEVDVNWYRVLDRQPAR